jgi:hypothetical protein
MSKSGIGLAAAVLLGLGGVTLHAADGAAKAPVATTEGSVPAGSLVQMPSAIPVPGAKAASTLGSKVARKYRTKPCQQTTKEAKSCRKKGRV